MASSKVCFKCGIEKPIDQFYAHPGMADGRLGKCKECTKDDSNKRRLDNLEKVRAYDRSRAKLTDRARMSAAVTAAWRKADYRRGRCHNKVARAIMSGALIHKACEWEGCDRDDSMAHHESYDHPLVVVWYCQPHHKKRHAEMKKVGIIP